MSLMNRIRQAVYPADAVCCLCGYLSRGSILCSECRERLNLLTMREPLCARCGAPLQPEHECNCELPPYLTARSVWRYQDAAAQLVQTVKFSQVKDAHEPLAAGIAHALASMSLPKNIVVTWITMPESRWRERSFDHAGEIAKTVSALLQLPCRQLLVRNEAEHELQHQVGLTAQERARNLRGSFICKSSLQGTVILIDDVYTTGATTREAAACLHEAGAEQIVAITAARSLLDQ